MAAVVTIRAFGAEDRGSVRVVGGADAASALQVSEGDAIGTTFVPLDDDGAVHLHNSVAMRLQVTVHGYFTASGGPARAGRFVTAGPAALFDGRLSPGKVLAVDHGLDGVAAGRPLAVVVVASTDGANSGGTLRVGGVDAGVVRAGGRPSTTMAVAAVAGDGTVPVEVTTAAHVRIDVVGVFTGQDAAPEVAGLFVPATGRALDTRGFEGLGAGTRAVSVAGRFGIAGCPRAVLATAIVVPQGGPAAARLVPYRRASDAWPVTVHGEVVGAGTSAAIVVPAGDDAKLGIEVSSPAAVVVDVVGWFL